MHYIHQLHDLQYSICLLYLDATDFQSPQHARRVLRLYILQRLSPDENHEWTEAAVLTYVWMSTSSEEQIKDQDLHMIQDDLYSIEEALKGPLRASAAQAALPVSVTIGCLIRRSHVAATLEADRESIPA